MVASHYLSELVHSRSLLAGSQGTRARGPFLAPRGAKSAGAMAKGKTCFRFRPSRELPGRGKSALPELQRCPNKRACCPAVTRPFHRGVGDAVLPGEATAATRAFTALRPKPRGTKQQRSFLPPSGKHPCPLPYCRPLCQATCPGDNLPESRDSPRAPWPQAQLQKACLAPQTSGRLVDLEKPSEHHPRKPCKPKSHDHLPFACGHPLCLERMRKSARHCDRVVKAVD